MLKQLKLNKQLELRNAELAAVNEKLAALATRAAEVEIAIAEVETDDDLNVIEEESAGLEKEQEAAEAEKTRIAEAIAEIEADIAELKENNPVKQPEERGDKMGNNEGLTREDYKFLNNMNYRAQVAETMKREEVRNFYTAISEAVTNKRALSNTDLLIPEIVLNRIQILVGDYGKLYSEVDVVRVGGTMRVVMDGANPEAIWVEMCDPVQELSSSFNAVELDGFKVGGFIPVCNAILEDSMINLATYVEQKLALAIAKALDNAILNGTGSTGKQPIGIIPNLAADNIVALDDSSTEGGVFGSLFANMGLIDTGENSIGEVIAVMKRSTYYSLVAPRLVIVNSGGTYTLPNVNNPNFAGLRVVFSQYMPDNQVLVGDFKKYILAERAGVQLAVSTDVRFIEDQTVFRGTARYDGKPVNVDDSGLTSDFILATIPALASTSGN